MTNSPEVPEDITFTVEMAQARAEAALEEFPREMRRIRDLISDAAQDEISALAEKIADGMGVEPEEDEEHLAGIQDQIFISALAQIMQID